MVKKLFSEKNIIAYLVIAGLFSVLSAVVYRSEIIPRIEEGFPFWRGWFWAGFGILLAMILFAYVSLFVLKAKLELTFLAVGGCIAILFNFLILPGSIPDEPDHIATSYYFSNKLMGIPDPEPYEEENGALRECIYVRQTDYEFMNRFQLTPTLKEYHYVRDYSKETGVSPELMAYGRSKYTENWLTYIPTILTTTVCRLLGVNGVMTIFAGRAIQTVIYLLVFFFAIRLLPMGKSVLFLLGLCPITVQQCISFTYDAAAIEASVLFFALLFRILYGARSVGLRDTILIGALLFLLASCKGGIYIPEGLFVLLIPKERYKSVRVCRITRLIFLGCIAAGFLTNTFGYLLVVLGLRENPLSGATAEYSTEITTYTLSDVLHNPIQAAYTLINTILIFADFYVKGAVSGPLAWLTVGISSFLGYGLLILMALAAVRTETEEVQIKKNHLRWFGIASILTFLMSAGAMLITWTDRNNNYITGLQGRYFTPLLPYLAFFFRRENIAVRRNYDRELAFAGAVVSALVIWNLLYGIRIAPL